MKTKAYLNDSTNANVRDSVAALIAYLWADESADWFANGKPNGHIYEHLKMLADWLNAFDDDAKIPLDNSDTPSHRVQANPTRFDANPNH